MALSGKQRRYLRSLGHALSPVVQIGRGGLTEAVVAAITQALDSHELIKIKVGSASDLERQEAADQAAQATGAEVAQVLGNTVLLYRRHPERPVIELPAREERPGSFGDS
ncbi:MAG TPA: ribosome assembly RNA-binding protein YhbY [Kofleriaceae bacterium]|nr:ribosome assembly RNA-binding protein YhbY [Kofleriaceae bacterium]